jgi:hypothetical protein
VTCDLIPRKFSCSATARTTRKPTKSPSDSHQMLCGSPGSRRFQCLSEPRRAALRHRSGGSAHEPQFYNISKEKAGQAAEAVQ